MKSFTCRVVLLLSLLLAGGAPALAVPPGWAVGASVGTPRDWHSATLLRDGSVLIAGGYATGTGATNKAERYFPATDTWVPVGNLVSRARQHAATLLADGRVLVVGGLDGSATTLRTAEIYDQATNAWLAVGDMGTARSDATATLLPDGKVLVAPGGFPNAFPTASAELFDPGRNAFVDPTGMLTARGGHVAVPTTGGNVLLIGGQINDRSPGRAGRALQLGHQAVVDARRMGAAPMAPGESTRGRPRARLRRVERHDLHRLGGGLQPGPEHLDADGSDGQRPRLPRIVDAAQRPRARNRWRQRRRVRRAEHGALQPGHQRVDVDREHDARAPRPDLDAADGRPRADRLGLVAGALVCGAVGAVDPTTTLLADPAVSFDDAVPGTAGRGAVARVTNTGDSPLLASGFALGGSFPGDYGIASDGCSGVAVPPGGTCVIGLRFAPGAAGARGATLTFEANTASVTHGVSLIGRGVSAAPLPAPAAPAKIVFTLAYGYSGVTSKATRLSGLTVKGVPAGSTITVTCKKGCATKKVVKRNVRGNVKITAIHKKKRLKVGTKGQVDHHARNGDGDQDAHDPQAQAAARPLRARQRSCWPPSMSYVAPVSAVLS